MFSTITYAAAIASLVGSVCLTQPLVKTTPTVELVYKVNSTPKEEYYKPVYVMTDSEATENNPTTFKPVLLTDVYQTN